MLGRNHSDNTGIEGPPGVLRRTLAHNNDVMLCHFELKRGATIPLHNHRPSQIGYVLRGRVRFRSDRNPEGFEVAAGDSYVFDPDEHHGAEALDDSAFIEVFSPARPEYA